MVSVFLLVLLTVYLSTAIFVFISNLNILRKHGLSVLNHLLSATFLWFIHLKNLGLRKYFAYYFQNKTSQEVEEAIYNKCKNKNLYDKTIYWIYCSRASDHPNFAVKSLSNEINKKLPHNFNIFVIINWIPTVGFKHVLQIETFKFNDDLYTNKNAISSRFIELKVELTKSDLDDCLEDISNKQIFLPAQMIDELYGFVQSDYKSEKEINIFKSEWFVSLQS